MNRICEIYIVKLNAPASVTYATIDLPATLYELLDALEKLNLQPMEKPYCELSEYYDFEYLAPFTDEKYDHSELNALALRLSELNDRQRIAFEGLIKSEVSKKTGLITVPRLIDLAYSTDCCHVVDAALNDSQLGRFYAENGFVPELDNIPDSVFEMLDFESIGRKLRLSEGGTFTPHGYVTQHSELNEVFGTLDLSTKKPDYQILLEVSKGCFNDPSYDNYQVFQLKLPTDEETLSAMLEHLDAVSFEECGWRCLDCRVPALIDAISNSEDLLEVVRFTNLLSGLDDKKMLIYKAVIEAAECTDLPAAVDFADHLENFMLDQEIKSAHELALSELKFSMSENGVELLQGFVNLVGYGQALLKQDNAVISPYGHLVRNDYQPIQAPFDAPRQDGMEMM